MAVVNLLRAWLLVVEAPVAAIVVFSSVSVAGPASVPSILAIVATVLHILLCIFCCATRSQDGTHYIWVSIAWLVACAGLWSGPAYFLGRFLTHPEDLNPERPKGALEVWVQVGCAMSLLSFFITTALIALSLAATRRPSQPDLPEKPGSSSSSDSEALPPPPPPPPQLPSLSPLQRQRISFPFSRSSRSSRSQRSSRHERRTVRLVTPSSSSPSTNLSSTPPTPPPKPPGYQPRPPMPWYFAVITHPSLPPNRVNLILALCHLQLPEGNFPATPLLSHLLSAWTNRPIPLSSGSGSSGSSGSGSGSSGSTGTETPGATALAHACLTDLCQTIWQAQREGTEGYVLTEEELWSLERVGWDLKWVAPRIELAGRWLRDRTEGSTGSSQSRGKPSRRR
ncbi:hypothetical protein VTJ04DRAFT_4483 [Mycothermus thermophilus]|uniref:uncharacterized protein n=1 Tax=Humicola insolens TaxID=85995 RepID=UPI00374357E3